MIFSHVLYQLSYLGAGPANAGIAERRALYGLTVRLSSKGRGHGGAVTCALAPQSGSPAARA